MLIIEDEEDILDNLKELFSRDSNIVFTATNGEDGLRLAIEKIPDIIISDIMMPGMTGIELKIKIHENIYTKNVPFIFYTAKAEMESMREGMNLGADDYLIKPMRNNEILESIYNRLKRIKELKAQNLDESGSSKLLIEDKIMLNKGKERYLVQLNNIHLIESMGNYTNVSTLEGKKTLIKKTMKEWEEILPEKIFIRVHHKTIVNFNHVIKIEPFFNGSFVIKIKQHNENIISSKRYSQKIKNQFKV